MPGMPAAKMNDRIVATDIHILLIPTAAGAPVPTPTAMRFAGQLTLNLSPNVMIGGLPAATVGSAAINMPPHVPTGGPFASGVPTNQGQVTRGSSSVFINGKPAARAGDDAVTCTEALWPVPPKVVASGSVFIGG